MNNQLLPLAHYFELINTKINVLKMTFSSSITK